jgi:hypothetical protein
MGTLIGAMRGVGIAPEEMREAVLDFDLRSVEDMKPWRLALGAWQLLRSPYTLVRRSTMPQIFRALVGDVRATATLGDLDPPLAAGAVDVVSRRLVVYSSRMHPSMPVLDLLEITTAIPPLFPLVRRKGNALVDASVSWSAPIWLTAAFPGARPITVLRALRAVERRGDDARASASVLRNIGQQSHDAFVIDSTPDVTVHDLVSRYGPVARLNRDQRKQLMDLGRTAVARADEYRAESLEAVYAGILYGRHHNCARAASPITVLIAYAREDEIWVKKLRVYLDALVLDPQVSVWHDEYLRPGDRWRPAIEHAISRAAVAIVIWSADAAASSFIRDTELRLLVERAAEDGMRLMWLSIDDAPVPEALLEYQGVALLGEDDATTDRHLAVLARDAERHLRSRRLGDEP